MAVPGREVLDDLCMRFIMNVPSEELRSFERMLFQVEQAHWYYEDFVRMERPGELRSLRLRDFASIMFEHPALRAYHGMLEDIYQRFNEYKHNVPTMGGILLDPELEHCLLVKGPKASSTWGFPKGKKDQGEEDIACAAREVYEETSFDCAALLAEEHSIEVYQSGQRSKLYIAPGVDRATPFAPQTRGEISEYAWFPISELPAHKNDGNNLLVEADGQRHRFFKIMAFTKPLRQWVKAQRKRNKKKKKDKGRKETGAGETQFHAPAIVSAGRPAADGLGGLRGRQGAGPPPKASWTQFAFDVPAILAAIK